MSERYGVILSGAISDTLAYRVRFAEAARRGGGDDSGNMGTTFYSTDFTTQVDRDCAALAGEEAA